MRSFCEQSPASVVEMRKERESLPSATSNATRMGFGALTRSGWQAHLVEWRRQLAAGDGRGQHDCVSLWVLDVREPLAPGLIYRRDDDGYALSLEARDR